VEVNKQSKAIKSVAPAAEVKKFHLRNGATRVDNRILVVSNPVVEGSLLVDDSGMKIQLGKKIGAGGEGTVFATSEKQVCKVYEGQRLTAGTKAKIELMLRKPVHHPGICWPLSLARNERGEFVGYFMNRATGRELQRTVFVKPLLEQIFPDWTRIQLVVLTASILNLVLLLHERNVLIGDISHRNILVKDEKTVFFVDTDSYQIEDFPCPVGTATFLPPELRGQDLSSVLRELRNEHFALATLVFMMLMPGKPPYSHAGGGDPAENVRTRHFPYALGEKRGKGVPDGPWRFMWSHLPFYLKEMFHQVFSDEKRPSAADWRTTMKRYYSDLTNGYLSHEIFPTSFKLLNEAGELRKTNTRQPLPDKGGTAVVSGENAKTSKPFRSLYQSETESSKNKTDDSKVISLGIAEALKVFTDIKGIYCLVYDPKIQGKVQGQSRGDAVFLWHAHWKKTYSYHPHTFRASMVEVASNGPSKKRFVETLSAYLSWQESSGNRLKN
jgi:ribosomal protein L27